MVNRTLKAWVAAYGAFVGAIVASSEAATLSLSEVSLTTWLIALGAAANVWVATYYAPNQ